MPFKPVCCRVCSPSLPLITCQEDGRAGRLVPVCPYVGLLPVTFMTCEARRRGTEKRRRLCRCSAAIEPEACSMMALGEGARAQSFGDSTLELIPFREWSNIASGNRCSQGWVIRFVRAAMHRFCSHHTSTLLMCTMADGVATQPLKAHYDGGALLCWSQDHGGDGPHQQILCQILESMWRASFFGFRQGSGHPRRLPPLSRGP